MKSRNTSANKLQKGFTLIELLVVIGILAVLLAITLIAINPARQFAQANDTKRRSAVTQVLNAIGAYHADNRGNYPTSLIDGTTNAVIGSDTAGGQIDICAAIVPDYMPALPQDPNSAGGVDILCGTGQADFGLPYNSGYRITRAGGRITVIADSEVNPVTPNSDITVTR